ncbi:MAG: 50S ribosomal protein L35 [Armatimonadota bacterium]
MIILDTKTFATGLVCLGRRTRGIRCLEREEEMPKIRTKKAAAKRFKITGTGKIVRRCTGKGHLMMKKSGARRRRLTLEAEVSGGERQKVHRLVPYG